MHSSLPNGKVEDTIPLGRAVEEEDMAKRRVALSAPTGTVTTGLLTLVR